jgi:hypothetical protein
MKKKDIKEIGNMEKRNRSKEGYLKEIEDL